ncbi:MAG: spheroidene monooxygenase [Paracoccaceae bacterium]
MDTHAPDPAARPCATLSLYRFDRLRDRAWAFAQMGLARPALRASAATFFKLCGSGRGFVPRPNPAVWAILATWPDLPTARDWTARGAHGRFRARAGAHWTGYLSAAAARGEWSGRTPFVPGPTPDGAPLAVMTRASVRPGALRAFWGHTPGVNARIAADPHALLAIGIGEVPLLHQVTFSIWPDTAAMTRFARTGAHAAAITDMRAHGWFSEELYARFALIAQDGRWPGARLTPDHTGPNPIPSARPEAA